MTGEYSVEVVRGSLGDRSEQILRLWAERAGLSRAEGEKRLSGVVCVLLAPDGEIAGTNSVLEADVEEIGGRRFWVYRMLITPEAGPQHAVPLLAAAYDALDAEFSGAGPVGICVPLTDPSVFPHHEEAYWPDLGMIYAGFLPDGRQLRIRYFEGARI